MDTLNRANQFSSNLCAQVAPWFSTFCISATRSEVMIFTDKRRSSATSSKAKGNGWSLLGLRWSRDFTEKKHGMEKVLDGYVMNISIICICMYVCTYVRTYVCICVCVIWDFKVMKEKKNFQTLMGTVWGTSAKIPANELSNFAPCSTEPARCVVKGIATFRFVKRPRAFPLQDHALLGGSWWKAHPGTCPSPSASSRWVIQNGKNMKKPNKVSLEVSETAWKPIIFHIVSLVTVIMAIPSECFTSGVGVLLARHAAPSTGVLWVIMKCW